MNGFGDAAAICAGLWKVQKTAVSSERRTSALQTPESVPEKVQRIDVSRKVCETPTEHPKSMTWKYEKRTPGVYQHLYLKKKYNKKQSLS